MARKDGDYCIGGRWNLSDLENAGAQMEGFGLRGRVRALKAETSSRLVIEEANH